MTNLDTMENLCPAAIPPSRRRYETAGMRAANRSFCMMSSMLRCWQKISARCCPTTDTSAFASGGTTNAKNKDKQSSADTHGASGTNCWRVFRRHRVAFPNEAFAATQLPWRHPPVSTPRGCSPVNKKIKLQLLNFYGMLRVMWEIRKREVIWSKKCTIFYGRKNRFRAVQPR